MLRFILNLFPVCHPNVSILPNINDALMLKVVTTRTGSLKDKDIQIVVVEPANNGDAKIKALSFYRGVFLQVGLIAPTAAGGHS